MGPKKKGEPSVERKILGRFRNNLKMGIVGLPNVGKSTFFSTLTKLNVAAENYPFCTIEPNEARVSIPDERFDWLCEFYKPASQVPAVLDVWDIAGLVRGAHEGAGLGNAFLSNIQAVDGLYHVCRTFRDENISHVEGEVDPVRDLEIIADELRLKDMEKVDKIIPDLRRRVEQFGHNAPKDITNELKVMEKVKKCLDEDEQPVRSAEWTNAEIEFLNRHLFLTAKPAVFLVNLSEKDYIRKKNKWLAKIKQWVDEHSQEPIIPFSAALESRLADIEANESKEAVQGYLTEHKCTSALEKIIKTGYKTLQLIYFFTAGSDEVKCWTIRKGSLAPQAAGTIHTDFERGFICAEVMTFDDLRELGNEAAVKADGKYKQQGKMYVVRDGDICNFKFNVTAKKGKK